MSDKVIGIIGGLGPEATIDLYRKIIAATPADIEQEHLRVLIDSNPKTPCRIKAILEGGISSGPVLAEMAQGLERSGADLLVMACNTAHYYYPQIVDAVDIPVLNIIEETVKSIKKLLPNIHRVGIMASHALLQTGLYQEALNHGGLKVIRPSDGEAAKMMTCIFRFKAGSGADSIQHEVQALARKLIDNGAQVIIAGCTELPLLIRDEDLRVPLVDPTEVLAIAAVSIAKDI